MRFKIKKNDQHKHTEICTSVGWTVNNEVYSTSDDNFIFKWEIDTFQPTKFQELDQFSTCLDWNPMSKGVNDIVAVGFIDGCFKLISKLGKIEKSVADAHKNGALVCLKWSHDGGSLATAGEDGSIKVWSKTGNLRSNLVQTDKPIYSVMWSPDNESVIYSTNQNIYIKPLQAGQKQIQWKAHDGVVLKVDWNPSNNLILSCGEDCKYKMWDSFGRLVYSSAPYDYVITSIGWSPGGQYFAVGSFGMFKLCDKTGWTYSFEKTDNGSIMDVAWSSDGNICAGACGNGQVIFGYIVDRQLNYENWEVNLNEDNKITVQDLINEINEELDFKERVIEMSMAYNHLIVNTTHQCYIYSFSNWNTPIIFDIKDSVSLIVQSQKYFALIEVTQGIMIYNYDGKLASNPKIPAIKYEFLSSTRLSITQDILAIVDGSNAKVLKFFDILTGKQMNFTLEHSLEILEICMNQTESAADRKIAFMDVNRDLHLSPVHKRDVIKLAAMTDSFLWNDKNDILACIADGRLQAWYYPNAIYVDKDLMDLCKLTREAQEVGRMGQMLTFSGSQVQVRRKDGGLITLPISPYPNILFDFCEKNKWEKAIKLCRFVKEQSLWACLAAISLHARELNTAEIALAAIEAVDKVQFINYVKELPSDVTRSAALSLYFHKTAEAEQIFIQNKLYYRAVKLNIKLYRWERALELALNFKTHIDTVLAYRKRYLESIGKEESNKKFQKLVSEVDVNWEQIKQNIREEKDREATLK